MDTIVETSAGRVRVCSLAEIRDSPAWRMSFSDRAKDHRYFETVDETLSGDFDFRCAAVEDREGRTCAIQPLFFLDQDIAVTAPGSLRLLVRRLRVGFPRLLKLRTLMVGCAAGEGGVAAPRQECRSHFVTALREALPEIARRAGAALIVWKDSPAEERETMQSLTVGGVFLRAPSMPATRLRLEFATFEEFLQRRVSHASRKDLRRKFKAAVPLEMNIVTSVADIAGEVHALYSQVFARSRLRFERLSREFLAQLGERMPDRARFFLWRKDGRLVACSICLLHDGILYDEYLGLDYAVALDWHLYFITLRDMLTWAIEHGVREYRSTPLNYEPKLRLGFELAPLDLYVAGATPFRHALVRGGLPFIQPARSEPLLQRFPNAREM